MPRGMRWVILTALLFLMLTPTRVGAVRAMLVYLRWVPPFVLGLAALFLAVRNRALPRPLNRADAFILAFVVLALLSSLYSIDLEITVLRGLSVLLMYGAVFWGVWMYADAHGAESVARIIVTVALTGFGLHFVFSAVFPVRAFPYYGRLAGWAENPGTLGALAAITMPLVLWRGLQSGRWYYWMLVGFLLVGVVLAQARLETLAVVVGSGYYLIREFPHRKRLVVATGIAVIGVMLLWGRVGTNLVSLAVEGKVFPSAIATAFPAPGGEAGKAVDATDLAGDTVLTDVVPSDVVPSDVVPSDVVPSDVVPSDVVPSDVVPTDVVLTDVVPTDVVPTEVVKAAKTIYERLGELDDRNSLENYVTLSGRVDKWAYGARYFLEKPLLGFGFGTEDRLFAHHGEPPNDYVYSGRYFHNSFLGMALQLGLVGAALFFLPLGTMIITEHRHPNITQCGQAHDALLGVVLAGLTSSVFSSWLYSMGNAGAYPFWMCVMLLIRFNVQGGAPTRAFSRSVDA